MTLQTTALERSFKLELGNETLIVSDPNPVLTPESVKAHLTAIYPELASGAVEGPVIENDRQVFTISGKKVGVKG